MIAHRFANHFNEKAQNQKNNSQSDGLYAIHLHIREKIGQYAGYTDAIAFVYTVFFHAYLWVDFVNSHSELLVIGVTTVFTIAGTYIVYRMLMICYLVSGIHVAMYGSVIIGYASIFIVDILNSIPV